jgi:hypothetical protein
MLSVHQPWDPLRVCVVGRSYPPEFYSFIKNTRLRSLFEKIATETEEDFALLISTLERFGVKTVRPNTPTVPVDDYITSQRRIPGPISMNPRDQMIMVGNKFFVFPYDYISVKSSGRNIPPTNWTPEVYNQLKGPSWPQEFTKYYCLPEWIQQECKHLLNFDVVGENHQEIFEKAAEFPWWAPITDFVESAGNRVFYNTDYKLLNQIPANGITRIGRDLYFGVRGSPLEDSEIEKISQEFFSDYRCHFITTGGHIDGCFCPVNPGLIVSIKDIATYEKTFPGWEVVYLEGESWEKVQPFLDLKKQNQGRWWIKGSEYDNELIDYVETWLRDWVGYAEESVFDVNILVIDQKNIIVNGYNKQAFDAFDRYGITAHICPIRHRYFWDGGVHCVTLDLDRSGAMQDFFPGRNKI